MSNLRIRKKFHTNFLGDFLIEASQDEAWQGHLKKLPMDERIGSDDLGYPQEFAALADYAILPPLSYSVERVALKDIPRRVSCWWPIEENTHYYLCYPTEFPKTQLYLAIDFDDHSDCCG
ncbi:MAG: hypothetical protein P1U57_14200 [Oleibacter sp.]|nr:hypothetical protein [Thalassolituus sp.]